MGSDQRRNQTPDLDRITPGPDERGKLIEPELTRSRVEKRFFPARISMS